MSTDHFAAFALLVGAMAIPLAAQSESKKLLTAQEASAIALGAQPGTIAEAEHDEFSGEALAEQ